MTIQFIDDSKHNACIIVSAGLLTLTSLPPTCAISLDRERASGVPCCPCAQLAIAVAPKGIHQTGGRHERQRVVPINTGVG